MQGMQQASDFLRLAQHRASGGSSKLLEMISCKRSMLWQAGGDAQLPQVAHRNKRYNEQIPQQPKKQWPVESGCLLLLFDLLLLLCLSHGPLQDPTRLLLSCASGALASAKPSMKAVISWSWSREWK